MATGRTLLYDPARRPAEGFLPLYPYLSRGGVRCRASGVWILGDRRLSVVVRSSRSPSLSQTVHRDECWREILRSFLVRAPGPHQDARDV